MKGRSSHFGMTGLIDSPLIDPLGLRKFPTMGQRKGGGYGTHKHPQVLYIAPKSPPSRSLGVETGFSLSAVCPAGGRRDAGPGPAGPCRHGSAPAGYYVMVGLTPWLLRHRGFSPLNRFPIWLLHHNWQNHH